MAIVYRITNTVNGKRYIGISRKTLACRWRQHRWDAKNKTRASLLHKAMRKYGESVFTLEVLHTVATDAEAKSLEILEIAQQNTLPPTGYNLSPGGELSGPEGRRARFWLGKKRSPETREKIRIANIGRPPPSEHTRQLISQAHKGKRLSDEHRGKIAAGKIGPRNPMFGKPVSTERRLHQSKALTGLKRSPEFGAQITARQRIKAPGAKLNQDQVREIRRARRAGEMGKTLADRFGVSKQTISLVCNGTRWGHVE